MVEGKKEKEKKGKALPDGWRWVTLGDITEVNPRRSSDLNQSDEVLTTFVPMPAVDALSGTIDQAEIKPFGTVKKGYTYFEENDVLFAKITPCMENGKHAIARNLLNKFGFGTTEFHVIRPSQSITPEWIHFFVRQPRILQDATAYFTGSVGQQRVPKEFLENLLIPLPPIEEQRRIVAILSERLAAVDQARRATQAQLEAAQALPAAYLREIFNSPEAQTWKRKPLGDVADFKNGINFTSDQKGKGLLTVDVLNMYSDNLFIRINDLYRVDIEASEDYLLKPDDILFVRSSVKREGVGWTALCPDLQEPMTFCGFIIRTRLTTYELIPEFLAHYCRTSFVREELISKSGTGTITNISQTQLKTLTVPLPSLDDQKRIVQALNEKVQETHRLQHHLISQLDTINALPAALLRQAFSGEL